MTFRDVCTIYIVKFTRRHRLPYRFGSGITLLLSNRGRNFVLVIIVTLVNGGIVTDVIYAAAVTVTVNHGVIVVDVVNAVVVDIHDVSTIPPPFKPATAFDWPFSNTSFRCVILMSTAITTTFVVVRIIHCRVGVG